MNFNNQEIFDIAANRKNNILVKGKDLVIVIKNINNIFSVSPCDKCSDIYDAIVKEVDKHSIGELEELAMLIGHNASKSFESFHSFYKNTNCYRKKDEVVEKLAYVMLAAKRYNGIYVPLEPNEASIILPKDRHEKIKALAVDKSNSLEIIPKAELWLGHGNYIPEAKGLVANDDWNKKYMQDVKVLAFAAINPENFNDIKQESEQRITEKKANLNCWQFCLLSYLEAGRISWKAVGELYAFLDKGKNKRVPDALKFNKFSLLNVNDSDPQKTPKAGDILCFGLTVDRDWHCAIFLNYDKESNSLSLIEILEDKVKIEKYAISCLDNYIMTFVRAEDVEDNILNFLNYHF